MTAGFQGKTICSTRAWLAPRLFDDCQVLTDNQWTRVGLANRSRPDLATVIKREPGAGEVRQNEHLHARYRKPGECQLTGDAVTGVQDIDVAVDDYGVSGLRAVSLCGRTTGRAEQDELSAILRCFVCV